MLLKPCALDDLPHACCLVTDAITHTAATTSPQSDSDPYLQDVFRSALDVHNAFLTDVLTGQPVFRVPIHAAMCSEAWTRANAAYWPFDEIKHDLKETTAWEEMN